VLRLKLILALVMMLITSAAYGAPTKRYITAVMVGPERESGELEKVFVELLGRLNVTLAAVRADAFDVRTVVTPKGQSDEALLARVWIDLRSSREASLYLADRAWERVLIRTVPVQSTDDEVAREQLGHILQAAAETLLAGGLVGRPRDEVQKELGVAPPPPPPPAPLPKPPPAPPKQEPPPEPEASIAPTLWLGAGWELWAFSTPERVTHGPYLRTELEFLDGPWRPGGAVSVAYHLPIVTSDQPIDVRIDALAIRLRAQLARVLLPELHLRAALGGGIDLVHLDPRSEIVSAEPSPQRWTRVPVMGTSLGIRWLAIPSLAVETALGLEVTLIDTRYIITVRDQKRLALDPWTVRPGATLGLAWSP